MCAIEAARSCPQKKHGFTTSQWSLAVVHHPFSHVLIAPARMPAVASFIEWIICSWGTTTLKLNIFDHRRAVVEAITGWFASFEIVVEIAACNSLLPCTGCFQLPCQQVASCGGFLECLRQLRW